MFSLKKVVQARLPVMSTQKRFFQEFTAKRYLTGQDRMVLDKLKWTGIQGKHLWMMLGVGNLIGYGLSNTMKPANYANYFHYKGNEKFFAPFRSLIGSDRLYNVGWTAPTLILGGHWAQGVFGNLRTAKLFFGCLAMSYFFMSAFGPGGPIAGGLEFINYSPFGLLKPCSSNGPWNSYMCGADPMASSLIYFALAYYRLWMVIPPLLMFDALVFGPKQLGGSVAAVGAVLCL